MSYTFAGPSTTGAYQSSSGGGLSNTAGQIWDWGKGLFGEIVIKTDKGEVSIGEGGVKAKIDTSKGSVSMNTGTQGGVYVEQIKNAASETTTTAGTKPTDYTGLGMLLAGAAGLYYWLK